MRIDGGCHCGFVTFEAEADPEKVAICHCTDCQSSTRAPRSERTSRCRAAHVQDALGHTDDLRQDHRGQRQSAGAGVLSHPAARRSTRRRRRDGPQTYLHPGCRHHQPARPVRAESSQLWATLAARPGSMSSKASARSPKQEIPAAGHAEAEQRPHHRARRREDLPCRRFDACALSASAAFGAAWTAPAWAQQELRLLNAFDSRYPPTKILVQKIRRDDRPPKTGGKITFRISGPEVVNAFQQFQPASSGAFDVLFYRAALPRRHHLGVVRHLLRSTPTPVEFRQAGVVRLPRQGVRALQPEDPRDHSGPDRRHRRLPRSAAQAGHRAGRRSSRAGGCAATRCYRAAHPVTLGASMVQPAGRRGLFGHAEGHDRRRRSARSPAAMDLTSGTRSPNTRVRPSFGYIYQFLLGPPRRPTPSFAPDVQKSMADEAAATRSARHAGHGPRSSRLEDDEALHKAPGVDPDPARAQQKPPPRRARPSTTASGKPRPPRRPPATAPRNSRRSCA